MATSKYIYMEDDFLEVYIYIEVLNWCCLLLVMQIDKRKQNTYIGNMDALWMQKLERDRYLFSLSDLVWTGCSLRTTTLWTRLDRNQAGKYRHILIWKVSVLLLFHSFFFLVIHYYYFTLVFKARNSSLTRPEFMDPGWNFKSKLNNNNNNIISLYLS